MLYQIKLPFKNFSVEFTRVSFDCLGYFKTWCTLQVCTFFKVYQLVHYVLKQPFLVLKSLWCLAYNKCLAYELSCYTYSLNYGVKFEFYLVLYLFIKTLIRFLSDKNGCLTSLLYNILYQLLSHIFTSYFVFIFNKLISQTESKRYSMKGKSEGTPRMFFPLYTRVAPPIYVPAKSFKLMALRS